MKVFVIGTGAAGNKCVLNAIERGIVDVEDTMIINSTSKDFPKDYTGKKVVLTEVNTGCGKERSVAKEYTKKAMADGKFNITDEIAPYDTVIVITSVEGGTGSGSAPIIAKFFMQVYAKNAHIIALTGFEDDVRGLSNTVEFFKEVDSKIVLQTVSNKAYLAAAGSNKLRAEELANNDVADRISVLTGQDFIDGKQNIDDTDIMKLSNTSGYMTVGKKYFNKPLETRDDFDKIIKNMIYNSSSLTSTNSSAIRIGAILNISPASEDAVDFNFTNLKKAYGDPYEYFTQIQWDGEKEYIAFIASGMNLPLDEVKAVYDKYVESASRINNNTDGFFAAVEDMSRLDLDEKFDMVKRINNGVSLADFLSDN